MQQNNDIVISYALADDKPLEGSDKGWVGSFVEFLEKLLTQVLGEKPSILLDPENANQHFQSVSDTGLLITILSENFTQSAACVNEAKEYIKSLDRLNTTTANRFFKVVHSPVPLDKQPDEIRKYIGYDLFTFDANKEVVSDFSHVLQQDASSAVWLKLVDLAYDIYKSLLHFRKSTENQEASTKEEENKFTIYLAETSPDLAPARDKVKRELIGRGFSVIPKNTIFANSPIIEKVIEGELADADYAIHMIGGQYGESNLDLDKSLVQIQNDVAAQRKEVLEMSGAGHSFERIIWMPTDIHIEDERQEVFVDDLKRNSEVIRDAEVLQIPLEELKSIIFNDLQEKRVRKEFANLMDKNSNNPSVYLIFDKTDSSIAEELKALLESNGLEVFLTSLKVTLFN